jgi:choline dehydrogenase
MAYDYVIVGAGSAGCVLASRLTEDPALRVLLLEAGGSDRRREVSIPAVFTNLFRTECDWAYETQPQPACAGRALYWPRGKMVGGCSSMNAMIYIRGHAADYDAWAKDGNDGWSAAQLEPYVRRARAHMSVSALRCVNPVSRAFVEAGVELGFPRRTDFNEPDPSGFGLYQVTQRRGRRHSVSDGYLRPALARANLTVKTAVHATRVLFDGTRAVGVEYAEGGQRARVVAERETIVCAGAVGSPHLLLLSGIGPAAELAAHGVRVVVDLPGVGRNLHDHLATGLAHACTQPVSLANAESLTSIVRYGLGRGGPLTSNVAEAGAFLTLGAGATAPDLQLHFAPAFFVDHGFTRPAGHGFTIGPTLLTPRSRGRITLRSTNPFTAPAIDPQYLSAAEDVALLVEGLALGRQLAATRALAPFRGAETLPGPHVQGADALAAYVRERSETLYHPVGTCRMGHDATAVVDRFLRVHGVQRLRVVDASIMPTITRGNTNAPTVMIAEKAADLLRA